MTRIALWLVSLLFLGCVLPVFGQQLATTSTSAIVPPLVRFTGVLADSNGKPLNGVVVSVTLSLYKDSQDNAPLWMETQNVRPDRSGHYSLMLGSTKNLPIEFFTSGEARWLGVQPEGQPEQPRILLLSVPYALKAADAESLGGKPASAFVLAAPEGAGSTQATASTLSIAAPAGGGTPNAPLKMVRKITGGTTNFVPLWTSPTTLGISELFQTAHRVGVGTTSPGAKLDVLTGNPVAIRSTALAPSAVAVYGIAAATNGSGAGVIGEAHSSSAIAGVFNNVAGGTGISGTGDPGVQGTGAKDAEGRQIGTGVSGSSGSGYGVYGFSNDTAIFGVSGTNGTGVVGVSNGGFGVIGRDNSGVGEGVLALGHIGLDGSSNDPTGFATGGFSDSNIAVHGDTNTGIAIHAVVGDPGVGQAGYFGGNVTVTGNLSKGGGSFKIDHPLDPANKYLYHSFVESPDMKNIYDGVVVLDSNGDAVVQLPDWFQTLNRDFRYQLTAIGAAGPNLYIAQELSGNQFKIAGGKPGAKVSWQITGVRQDAWANAHRIPVEEIKPVKERGYYIHPELYGAPKERGVEWARYPQFMRSLQETRARHLATARALQAKEPKPKR